MEDNREVTSLLPPCRSRVRIQAIRLVSKHLCLLSHLAGLLYSSLALTFPQNPNMAPSLAQVPYNQLSQSSSLSKYDIS